MTNVWNIFPTATRMLESPNSSWDLWQLMVSVDLTSGSGWSWLPSSSSSSVHVSAAFAVDSANVSTSTFTFPSEHHRSGAHKQSTVNITKIHFWGVTCEALKLLGHWKWTSFLTEWLWPRLYLYKPNWKYFTRYTGCPSYFSRLMYLISQQIRYEDRPEMMIGLTSDI